LYRRKIRHLSLILACSLFLLAGCESRQQIFSQRLLQFGTIIDITLIHHDADQAEQAFTDIEQKLEQFETYWHAWRDSDLYRFNRSLAKLEPVRIPESLFELLTLSKQYYQSSQQLFNPAIGKLIAAYGFHDNASKNEQLVNQIRRNLPTMNDIVISDRDATSLNPHLALDLGGIAKGYAMQKIAKQLKSAGFENFLINAGGDVVTSGKRFDRPWVIAIQNPFAPGAIASIQLSANQHLFTSGNYQRFYRKNNELVHHIIDPRTGKPSNNISSASVLSTDAVLADVAATTLMIDGWNKHASLAKSLGMTDYLIISQTGEMIASKSMSAKIKLLDDEKNPALLPVE
jgi:thiamine biosynthesis lipoprotein